MIDFLACDTCARLMGDVNAKGWETTLSHPRQRAGVVLVVRCPVCLTRCAWMDGVPRYIAEAAEVLRREDVLRGRA